MIKRIAAVCTTAALALGMVGLTATAAAAEDTPPPEETSLVAPEVVEEVIPEPEIIPEPEVPVEDPLPPTDPPESIIEPVPFAAFSVAEIVAVPVGVFGAIEPQISGPDGTNHEEFWEDRSGEGVHPDAICYKSGGNTAHGSITDDGKSVTLNPYGADWPGDHYEWLVVKAGNEWLNVIHHPSAGVAYGSPNNAAGNQANVSHWIVCKGITPDIEIKECPAETVQPTSTNVNPQGWTLVEGEYVEGGVEFTASNWSDAYASKDVSFPLSEAANLGFSTTGGNVWAIILVTTAGNVHYEPEPYSDDLWTNAPGILPANAGGQGGPYSGNLDDIISDPTVTQVLFYFTSGSAEAESAVGHSVSFNCQTQPFDWEPVPVTIQFDVQGPLAQCGVDGELPDLGLLPEGVSRLVERVGGGDGPGSYTVTFSALAGFIIVGQAVFNIEVPSALEYQNEDPEGECYIEPKEDVVVTGTPDCGDTSYPVTTTVFTLDPATGEYDEGVSTTENIAITPTACPTPGGLAFTGVNPTPLWAAGGLMLIVGILASLGVAWQRRIHN